MKRCKTPQEVALGGGVDACGNVCRMGLGWGCVQDCGMRRGGGGGRLGVCCDVTGVEGGGEFRCVDGEKRRGFGLSPRPLERESLEYGVEWIGLYCGYVCTEWVCTHTLCTKPADLIVGRIVA